VDDSPSQGVEKPASDARSSPRLILLPLAILLGALIGFGTLDLHQQADHPDHVRPHESSRPSGAPVSWQTYDVHSALQYLDHLARRLRS
jgi:hypothetical protein